MYLAKPIRLDVSSPDIRRLVRQKLSISLCIFRLQSPRLLQLHAQLLVFLVPLLHLCIRTPRVEKPGDMGQFRCNVLCGRHGKYPAAGNAHYVGGVNVPRRTGRLIRGPDVYFAFVLEKDGDADGWCGARARQSRRIWRRQVNLECEVWRGEISRWHVETGEGYFYFCGRAKLQPFLLLLDFNVYTTRL